MTALRDWETIPRGPVIETYRMNGLNGETTVSVRSINTGYAVNGHPVWTTKVIPRTKEPVMQFDYVAIDGLVISQEGRLVPRAHIDIVKTIARHGNLQEYYDNLRDRNGKLPNEDLYQNRG